MKKESFGVIAICLGFCALPLFAWQIGDGPVIQQHMDQSEIESGSVNLNQVLNHGKDLFVAKFNAYDGQGRPATTGGGAPRETGSAPAFLRTSAPDSNSCAGCHNDPFVGAAGDFVANVFVLAQVLDPVTFSVSPEFSNNRNTLGMHGAGLIEMLAREMTVDLQAIRDNALQKATADGTSVSAALSSKGVHFGSITANPDGSVDSSGVEGVDADLIIKPFHQKGAVISLREFTNNAMNHHHGMQAVERFGVARTGTDDFDQDGVADELTVGDITAATIWQAALNTPGQILPNDPSVARAIIRGERGFQRIGCESCHVSSMVLENDSFTEPNPFNPPGNLGVDDVASPYAFNLVTEGFKPRPEGTPDGKIIVRAFTDLKRHNLCDDDFDHFCNEEVVQGGVATEEFLTRKLWDVGNTAPYGHVGDLTTITEAIHYHGGEARASRDAFFALAQQEQDEIVEFLKSLQILPQGTEDLVVDETGKRKNKRQVERQHLRPLDKGSHTK